MRKTKIVSTLGPASRNPEMIKKLIEAGVNVFRLNFSHGSHEEHLENLTNIRKVAESLHSPVAILQDLCGPKIRISAVENDFQMIQDGAKIDLKSADGSLTSEKTIYVETLDPVRFLRPGDPVLLADGIISLVAEKNDGKAVTCKIIKGGRLRSKVGIAFPESPVDTPATTTKDMDDLTFGIKHGVDFVAISFVRDASDIRKVRDKVKELGGDVHLIAKIERKDAIKNLDEIAELSDGLMVARGDLGLELPLEQLPRVQREIIRKGNYLGTPVIVATQMLSSMVTSIRPTRAEVSDVSTAVMMGADAVMLSEETAIGENPIECVNYLSAIALEAEKSFVFEEYKLRMRDADHRTVADAVAYAACAAANKVNAAAVIACSTSGYSVRLLAKYRPNQPLFGSSTKVPALRRMSIFWGVTPVWLSEHSSNHIEELKTAISTIQKKYNIPKGALAVVTGGIEVNKVGATSVMEIREFE
jgi:pyruvate kinase